VVEEASGLVPADEASGADTKGSGVFARGLSEEPERLSGSVPIDEALEGRTGFSMTDSRGFSWGAFALKKEKEKKLENREEKLTEVELGGGGSVFCSVWGGESSRSLQW
jgi:hypothetical protein